MADQWHVTGIRQETQLAENDSGFRSVYKVNYEIHDGPAEGTRGHVIIPASQYNDEYANKAIEAVVQQHQRISNL
jgi:hypothetical protein